MYFDCRNFTLRIISREGSWILLKGPSFFIPDDPVQLVLTSMSVGRGAEHDFDGLDASLEEDAMDSLCTNPSEQGLGGQYGCGGQGCVHICIHALFQCARNIQVGTVLLTAQPSCDASQLTDAQ
jgi:hypothetical protein